MKGRKGDGASESRHATALRGARSRFQSPHHLQLSRSMLIRNIIVVKLIKSVIAHPADRKEGLRPVRSPKSFSEAPSPSTISFYVNSEYNSSEIDKTRYRPPDRWRDKNNF